MSDAMNPPVVRLNGPVGRLEVETGVGIVSALRFDWEGRTLSPLYYAPWREEADVQADPNISPLEKRLGGDFFCAPFGSSDVEPAPGHGWSANSPWSVEAEGPNSLELSLERPIMGAHITKRLALATDAPILYQEHAVAGGEGMLPVSYHPIFHFKTTARLSVSPKTRLLTPAAAVEPGRNKLASGIDTHLTQRVPGTNGEPVDVFALPIGDHHEDLMVMVEDPANALGWSALVREAEDDIVFVLKDPRILPVTTIWHSNAGRDYPPWNGRNRNVLGIEDGRTAGPDGHKAALVPNPVSRVGAETAWSLAADRTHRMALAIGAIPRPQGWQRVADITIEGATLSLREASGATTTLPFDATLFEGTC